MPQQGISNFCTFMNAQGAVPMQHDLSSLSLVCKQDTDSSEGLHASLLGLVQAVGETWEKFPELKFLALKRMYKYMVRPVNLPF